jgi:hypothetical protein
MVGRVVNTLGFLLMEGPIGGDLRKFRKAPGYLPSASY